MGFMGKHLVDTPKEFQSSDVETKIIPIQGFNHVYLTNDSRVTFYSAEETQIEYKAVSDKKSVKPNYEIRNDTLFLYSTKDVLYGRISIKIQNIESLSSNAAWVTFKQVSLDTLKVYF